MNRRTLLASLPIVGAASVLPAVAAPAKFDLQGWLDTAPREAVALYHLQQLAICKAEQFGGQWKGVMMDDVKVAMVVLWDKDKSGVFIKPNGDDHAR